MADCILLGGGLGSGSDDVTATKSMVLPGYTAITSDSNDEPVEGTMPTLAAGTFYPKTSDQKIDAGRFLLGDQVFKKVVTTNFLASNILNGVTMKIGYDGNPGAIAAITGNANVVKFISGTATTGSTRSTIGASNKTQWYTTTVNPGFTPLFLMCVSVWGFVWKYIRSNGVVCANFLTSYDIPNNGYSENFTGDWRSNSVTVYSYHVPNDTVWYWIFGK